MIFFSNIFKNQHGILINENKNFTYWFHKKVSKLKTNIEQKLQLQLVNFFYCLSFSYSEFIPHLGDIFFQGKYFSNL